MRDFLAQRTEQLRSISPCDVTLCCVSEQDIHMYKQQLSCRQDQYCLSSTGAFRVQ